MEHLSDLEFTRVAEKFAVLSMLGGYVSAWASFQMRKIEGCAYAGNAGNVFAATDFKGNRY